jgi:hypothetical protein
MRVYIGQPRPARDGKFEVQLRDVVNNTVQATAHGATPSQALLGARQLAVAMNEADNRERQRIIDDALAFALIGETLGPGSSTSQ